PSARKRTPTRVASIPKSKPRRVAKKPKPTAKPKLRRRPPAKVAVKDREGGYVVQVSAQKTLAAARGIAKRVSARHGDLFGAAKPYIIKAEISGKGTFYRVRVGPYRRQQQVASLCASLKGRGQACFTTKTN
ncbi:MAG: SPOR domain-containing protein, partial [Hyphomicrobiales bacterium]